MHYVVSSTRDLARGSSWVFKNRGFFKHEDPRAWSLTVLDNAAVIYIYGHVYNVIVVLS